MSKIEIGQVKQKYEQWRSEKRRETPVELRRLVLELARSYGEKAICAELGISAGSLWAWRRQSKNSNKIRPQKASQSKASKRLKFVELKQHVSGSQSPAIQVEWERADGTRMRVGGDLSVEKIGQLVSHFLGASGVVP